MEPLRLGPRTIHEHPRAIYQATMLLISEATSFLNDSDLKNEFVSLAKREPEVFLAEYATIKVGSHRRAGHTTAMLQIAAGQLTHPNSQVCLVFPNMEMERRAMQQFRHMSERWRDCVSMSIHNMDTRMRGCGPFDLVMVDGAAIISENQIKSLYLALAPTLVGGRVPLVIIFQ